MLVVFEDYVRLLENAATFNVYGAERVNENVADCLVIQQGLQWTKSEDLVKNFLCDAATLSCAQRHPLFRSKRLHHCQQLLLPTTPLAIVANTLQVHLGKQLLVNSRLDLLLHMLRHSTRRAYGRCEHPCRDLRAAVCLDHRVLTSDMSFVVITSTWRRWIPAF